MIRTLATLSAVAAFAAAAHAQCLNPAGGTSITGSLVSITGLDPVDDEGRSPVTPLGFTITMPGGGTFTDCVIESNGLIYLANGVNPPFLGNYSYGSLANLAGAAGSGPRIAPYWRDLYAMPTGWDITTQSVPGVSFTATWLNVTNYGATGTPKSFSAKLYATGAIEYTYSNITVESDAFVGLSIGNGLGSGAAISNIAANPTGGTLPLMWESFTPANWDLSNRTIRFTPNGLGGWDVSTPCNVNAASHTSYGAGCYTISDSLYQYFPTAALAGPGLTGTSLTFTPVGTTYLMTNGGGTFVPPSGGAVNVFATPQDDAEQIVTPSIAFPTPQGPQASVRIHSNGLVSWGASPQTFAAGPNYTPLPASLLAAVNPAIWFWHDFNENEAGSGRIVREEVVIGSSTVLCVTWNGVENYSNPTVLNPSTVQLQLDLSTGVAKVIWVSVDSNTTSAFGTAHLVGYSPGGTSADGGSQNLATALPVVVPNANMLAMSLAASPAPVSTPSSGTLVTYTQSNIPEAAPSSGIYVGLTILSLGQSLAGIDLGFLGMPGCNLHVASLDATISFVGVTNSLTTQFQIPAGVPYGLQLFAQSAALIAPNSLPNNQNAFGATLSNGLASFISAF
jgi:hypothetical protein